MVVTIVVTDPMYLREPMIISSHFKKQASDGRMEAFRLLGYL